MKDYEFEKLEITFGDEVSFLDNTGTTRYGKIETYNPLVPCFEFEEKDSATSETIYLKDVERFFRKD